MSTAPTSAPDTLWRDEGDDRCRRCGAPLESAYCAVCGQKRARRLSVRRLFDDLVSHVAALDFALVRTVVGLTRRPGELIRRYIAGDRTSVANPVKYAFLAASLYALTILLLGVDVRPSFGRAEDPRALASMRLVVSAIGYLLFVYMIPAAGVLCLSFHRWRVNLAEAYAGLLFYGGQYLLVLTVLAVAGVYDTSWGFWAARAGGLVLLLWVLWDWFRASALRTLIGGILVWIVVTVGGAVSGIAFVIAARLVRGHW